MKDITSDLNIQGQSYHSPSKETQDILIKECSYPGTALFYGLDHSSKVLAVLREEKFDQEKFNIENMVDCIYGSFATKLIIKNYMPEFKDDGLFFLNEEKFCKMPFASHPKSLIKFFNDEENVDYYFELSKKLSKEQIKLVDVIGYEGYVSAKFSHWISKETFPGLVDRLTVFEVEQKKIDNLEALSELVGLVSYNDENFVYPSPCYVSFLDADNQCSKNVYNTPIKNNIKVPRLRDAEPLAIASVFKHALTQEQGKSALFIINKGDESFLIPSQQDKDILRSILHNSELTKVPVNDVLLLGGFNEWRNEYYTLSLL